MLAIIQQKHLLPCTFGYQQPPPALDIYTTRALDQCALGYPYRLKSTHFLFKCFIGHINKIPFGPSFAFEKTFMWLIFFVYIVFMWLDFMICAAERAWDEMRLMVKIFISLFLINTCGNKVQILSHPMRGTARAFCTLRKT